MSEIIKFIKTSSKKEHWQFHVKVDFVKICPNYEEYSLYDLTSKTQVSEFLHNPVGPAVVNLDTGESEYWSNGKYIEAGTEDFKRIYHIKDFTDKFSKFLNEG